MRFTIKTFIPGKSPQEVFAHFGEPLFRVLSPGFPRITIIRFDGCRLNDETHIDMQFFGKRRWVSVNTAFSEKEQEIYFIDEGKTLPLGLKRWKHCHRVVAAPGGSIIRDEVEFDYGNFVLNVFWKIPLWIPFAMRPVKYRRFFEQLTAGNTLR
ncbi:MAG: hypothetical protein FD123_171 [Bacteroidetes bacterium]|nr:MAG: hypothetical protein FD123_171 [Bacteroidota bacterium]